MMNKEYIFLIDDNEEILGTVNRALTKEGYEVGQATSGKEGLALLNQRIPELLILDIIMPEMTGIEICRFLRADERYHQLPILFLTAKSATDDVVEGLDAGGDDYITKPFELTELHARVRALLRRAQRDALGDQVILQHGDLALNSATHQVEVGEYVVQLTTTEHRLLRYLMEHPDQALSPTHLLQAVWSYPPDAGDPDLVRAHVRNLRAKLERETNGRNFIKTLHGVGYMIYNPGE